MGNGNTTLQPWLERATFTNDAGTGTVEALPNPNAHFDAVLSMFGLMFAARR